MPPAPDARPVDRPVDRAVAHALDGARRPALVVTDLALDRVAGSDVRVQPLGAPAPDEHVRTLLLVVPDVAELRVAVSRLGDLGRARMVGVVVADAPAPVLLRPHPSWPAVTDLDARLVDGAAVTRLELAARADAVPVLHELARGAALPAVPGPAGLRVAGAVAPPVDPTYTPAYDAGAERPPDVLVSVTPDAGGPGEPSPVTGRVPVVVAASSLRQDGGLEEPLDEAVYNPCGFRRSPTRGRVDLPAGTRLTPALVAGLRDAGSVRLPADADPRLVAGLAMAGVLTEDVADEAEREQRSVRVRRAALLAHSTVAWRGRLAHVAGVRHVAPLDPGAVVLTTDDPDEVTDLLLARRYSGADLVVLPDDPSGPTECFVAEPPPGVAVHARGCSPEDVVAAGGLVYVGRPRGRG